MYTVLSVTQKPQVRLGVIAISNLVAAYCRSILRYNPVRLELELCQTLMELAKFVELARDGLSTSLLSLIIGV